MVIINHNSHSWALTPFLKWGSEWSLSVSGIPPYFKEMTDDQMQYSEKPRENLRLIELNMHQNTYIYLLNCNYLTF